MTRAVLVLAVLAGCPSKSDAPAATAPPPEKPVVADAGIDGITTISGYDPRSGMHLDDDVPGVVTAQPQPRTRPGRPIDITLRSSPSGARVAVDGVPKGLTPGYWEGTTGAEHEFTFVLDGYQMARYRFVPIASGVVHARLEPLTEETTDAGVPPMGVPPAMSPATPRVPPARVSPAVDAAVVRPPGPDAAIVVVPADAAVADPGSSGAGPQP
jgi:hypothetical protein